MAVVGGHKPTGRISGGRPPTAQPAGFMVVMPVRPRQHAWVKAVGAYMGVQSAGAGTARLGLYRMGTGQSPAPTTRLAQTGSFPVNTVMTNISNGGAFEAGLTEPMMIRAGELVGVAVVVNRGYRHLGAPNGTGAAPTRRMEDVNPGSNLPTTFVARDIAAHRDNAFWLEGTANRAPNVPQNPSPSHQQQVSSRRPFVEATFSDPNIADGDYLNQYQLEVWNQAGTTRVWPTNPATYTASTQERADNRMRRQVGVNLNLGLYEVRCRMSDGFGVWSPWRRWHVEIIQGGSVEGVRVSPSQMVDADRTLGDTPSVQYLPTHETGSGVSQLEFEVRHSAGVLVRGPATIARNDALGEWSPSLTGFASIGWSPLLRGQRYRFQARVLFQDGNYSPWASSELFRVNAPPSQPTNLSPASNAVTIERPELRASIADLDDSAADVESLFFLRDLSTNTLRQVPSTRLAGTTYTATPTSTQMPAVGDYEWYVRGRDTWGQDGTNSPTSGHLLRFRDPPVVTITSPAPDTVLTGSGFIGITVTSDTALQRRRVRVRNAQTNAQVIQYGWVTLNSATSFNATVNPVSWIRNNTSYVIEVEVETTDGIPHTEPVTIHVAYTPRPQLADMTATPVQGRYDMAGETTQVHLTWGPYPGNAANFEGYFVFRSAFDAGKEERIFLAHITDPAQLEMYDVTPTSNVAYAYQVTYLERVNQDEVESVPAVQEATVHLRSTVISAIRVWAGEQVNLPYWEDRIRSPQESASTFETWSGDSVSYASLNRGIRYEGAFPLVEIVGQERHNAEAIMTDLLALNRPEEIVVEIDGVPESRMVPKQLCLRDPRGRKGFGTIERLELVDRHIGYGLVELSFVTNDYREDVDEAVDQW